MKTKLILINKPNKALRSEGVDVVFKRIDRFDNVYTIYGCECYESWQQWGASKDVLSDNVDDIEAWRKSKD